MYKWIFRFGFLVFITIVSGCTTIPAEAPTLSSELGQRIQNLEAANIRLLHSFFDEKRKQIDVFVEHEWLPVFSDHFFRKPKIAQAWNTIVREQDNKQRTKFMIKVGSKLQKAINKKRVELIKPLDTLERRLVNSLKVEYAQAKAINNSVTSLLLSASKTTENRNRLLAKAGITEDKISNAIDKTDIIVGKLLAGANTIEEKTAMTEEYIQTLQELRSKF
ncbi:MAG: hypothetical protein D6B28_02750 [Gammaproteobacteria bacterium]|nr:MAG: hypothetical protein D6B28_02750 [Gammaproteobacteria bacterium]